MYFLLKSIFLLVFILVGAIQAQPSVKFIYHERLIFVKMKINERNEGLFLLDTGTSASAIDLKTVETLGLPIVGNDKVEGTAGTIKVKKTRIKSLSINGAKKKNLTIPTYDLSGVLTPKGMKLDGILGYDFLQNFVIKVDFVNETIEFSSKKPKGNSITIIPFTLDNGIPRFNALLNDSVKTDFRLDTGASLFKTSDIYLNITERNWQELIALDSSLKPETYFSGSGVGGTVRLPVARIKKLFIGNKTFATPFVIVQPKVGYFAREDAVGFISNNLLEKFGIVWIDYRAKEMKIMD